MHNVMLLKSITYYIYIIVCLFHLFLDNTVSWLFRRGHMDAQTQYYFIHNIQVHSSTYSLTLHSTTVYCAILVRLCVNQERTHSMDTIIAQQAIETVNYTLKTRFSFPKNSGETGAPRGDTVSGLIHCPDNQTNWLSQMQTIDEC